MYAFYPKTESMSAQVYHLTRDYFSPLTVKCDIDPNVTSPNLDV